MTRLEFPTAVKRDADKRANGICKCHRIPGWKGCGQPLGRGNRFYEHIIQCGAGGDNSLENSAMLTHTCWKKKTATQDLPIVAKVKRVRDRDRGIRTGSSRNPVLGFRRAREAILPVPEAGTNDAIDTFGGYRKGGTRWGVENEKRGKGGCHNAPFMVCLALVPTNGQSVVKSIDTSYGTRMIGTRAIIGSRN